MPLRASNSMLMMGIPKNLFFSYHFTIESECLIDLPNPKLVDKHYNTTT